MNQVPPQNIDAEARLLAACIIDSPAEALETLEPEDFYKPAHQYIFKAIKLLALRKETIDLTTIYTELKVMGKNEAAGGAGYLSGLLDIPAATDIKLYAKLVAATATARRLLLVCDSQRQLICGTQITHNNIDDVLAKFRSELAAIDNKGSDYRPKTFSEMCMARVEQYEELQGRPMGVRTGFPLLDYVTGGFWGSKLIIIAARPRIGKTALMMNMAQNMASKGHPVGVFSIEMDGEQLIDRQIAGGSGVNSIRPATGKKLSVEEWGKIHESVSSIYQYPIFIDDTGGLKLNELVRRTREMAKNGIWPIFIDQLSRVRGAPGKTSYEQNTNIVAELASLKKELRIPIVLLAQINRKADDRPDKKPTLQDLKNTGELEESADMVLLGHRPFVHTKKEEDRGLAEWELAKHRGGREINLYMTWDEETTTFHEQSTREVPEGAG